MPDAPTDFASSFWRGHVRLGVVSTSVCSSFGLAYALATPNGSHRPWVIQVAVVALLSCPLIGSPSVVRVLSGPGREPWLYAWSTSLLAAVTLAVLLDGGGRSPLTGLFAASLVFTATGFGRTGAAVMGAAAVGCYLLTCLVGSPPGWQVTMTALALSVAAATCALTAGRLRRSLEEQERLTRQLRIQATHDGLTGCLNHRAFIEGLEALIAQARADRDDLGLVMLDLDDFKRANDRHGHVVADELLTALGSALRACVREHDLVARIGGDEFAVALPGSGTGETSLMAARVSAELQAVGARLGVGVSVGITTLRDGDDSRDLRHRADQALYVTKRSRHGQPTVLAR